MQEAFQTETARRIDDAPRREAPSSLQINLFKGRKLASPASVANTREELRKKLFESTQPNNATTQQPRNVVVSANQESKASSINDLELSQLLTELSVEKQDEYERIVDAKDSLIELGREVSRDKEGLENAHKNLQKSILELVRVSQSVYKYDASLKTLIQTKQQIQAHLDANPSDPDLKNASSLLDQRLEVSYGRLATIIERSFLIDEYTSRTSEDDYTDLFDKITASITVEEPNKTYIDVPSIDNVLARANKVLEGKPRINIHEAEGASNDRQRRYFERRLEPLKNRTSAKWSATRAAEETKKTIDRIKQGVDNSKPILEGYGQDAFAYVEQREGLRASLDYANQASKVKRSSYESRSRPRLNTGIRTRAALAISRLKDFLSESRPLRRQQAVERTVEAGKKITTEIQDERTKTNSIANLMKSQTQAEFTAKEIETVSLAKDKASRLEQLAVERSQNLILQEDYRILLENVASVVARVGNIAKDDPLVGDAMKTSSNIQALKDFNSPNIEMTIRQRYERGVAFSKELENLIKYASYTEATRSALSIPELYESTTWRKGIFDETEAITKIADALKAKNDLDKNVLIANELNELKQDPKSTLRSYIGVLERQIGKETAALFRTKATAESFASIHKLYDSFRLSDIQALATTDELKAYVEQERDKGTSAAEIRSLLTNKIANNERTEELIGLAEDLGLSREEALKFLNEENGQHAQARKRILSENRTRQDNQFSELASVEAVKETDSLAGRLGLGDRYAIIRQELGTNASEQSVRAALLTEYESKFKQTEQENRDASEAAIATVVLEADVNATNQTARLLHVSDQTLDELRTKYVSESAVRQAMTNMATENQKKTFNEDLAVIAGQNIGDVRALVNNDETKVAQILVDKVKEHLTSITKGKINLQDNTIKQLRDTLAKVNKNEASSQNTIKGLTTQIQNLKRTTNTNETNYKKQITDLTTNKKLAELQYTNLQEEYNRAQKSNQTSDANLKDIQTKLKETEDNYIKTKSALEEAARLAKLDSDKKLADASLEKKSLEQEIERLNKTTVNNLAEQKNNDSVIESMTAKTKELETEIERLKIRDNASEIELTEATGTNTVRETELAQNVETLTTQLEEAESRASKNASLSSVIAALMTKESITEEELIETINNNQMPHSEEGRYQAITIIKNQKSGLLTKQAAQKVRQEALALDIDLSDVGDNDVIETLTLELDQKAQLANWKGKVKSLMDFLKQSNDNLETTKLAVQALSSNDVNQVKNVAEQLLVYFKADITANKALIDIYESSQARIFNVEDITLDNFDQYISAMVARYSTMTISDSVSAKGDLNMDVFNTLNADLVVTYGLMRSMAGNDQSMIDQLSSIENNDRKLTDDLSRYTYKQSLPQFIDTNIFLWAMSSVVNYSDPVREKIQRKTGQLSYQRMDYMIKLLKRMAFLRKDASIDKDIKPILSEFSKHDRNDLKYYGTTIDSTGSVNVGSDDFRTKMISKIKKLLQTYKKVSTGMTTKEENEYKAISTTISNMVRSMFPDYAPAPGKRHRR